MWTAFPLHAEKYLVYISKRQADLVSVILWFKSVPSERRYGSASSYLKTVLFPMFPICNHAVIRYYVIWANDIAKEAINRY